MGFFDWFRSAPTKEAPAMIETKAPLETAEQVHATIVGNKKSPPKRGEDALLDLYNISPSFRRVVEKISDSVASAEWVVGARVSEDGAKTRYLRAPQLIRGKPFQRKAKIAQVKQAGEFREFPEHPLLDLLDYGNDFMDGYAVRHVHNTYLDISGESFWLLVKDGKGKPQQIFPIPPTWVKDVPKMGKGEYELQLGQGTPLKVPQDMILWFKSPNPLNPYDRASGKGRALADELETDEYAAVLIKTAFFNKAVPYGILSLPGAGKEALEAAKSRLDDAHRGARRYGRNLVTSSAADYKRIEQDFEELQIVELRKFVRDQVMQMYGVPPEILGIVENSNRATISAAAFIMAVYVEVPRLERDRRMFQRYLVPMYDDRLIIDYISPVPEDQAFMLEVMKAAPEHFTRNDWRGMASFPEAEDGEKYLVPLNLQEEGKPQEEQEAEEELEMEIMEESEGEEEKSKAVTKQAIPLAEQEKIAALVDALDPDRLWVEVAPIQGSEMEAWANATLADIGVAPAFDLLNPQVVNFLDNFAGDRIQDLVNQNTKDALRATLIEGIEQGEDARRVRNRILQTFTEGNMDVTNVRAARIARTEVNRAANFANFQAYKQSGVISHKRWISTFVDTRDSHAEMHSMVRELDKPFPSPAGGETLYPGDFGIPEEDINCRCTVVTFDPDFDEMPEQPEFLEGKAPQMTDKDLAVWKGFIERSIPWRAKLEAALVRGFFNQLDDVLALYDKLTPPDTESPL